MADRSSKIQPEELELRDRSIAHNIKIEETVIKHDSHDNLVKMTPSGYETKFPRTDNYFMTK